MTFLTVMNYLPFCARCPTQVSRNHIHGAGNRRGRGREPYGFQSSNGPIKSQILSQSAAGCQQRSATCAQSSQPREPTAGQDRRVQIRGWKVNRPLRLADHNTYQVGLHRYFLGLIYHIYLAYKRKSQESQKLKESLPFSRYGHVPHSINTVLITCVIFLQNEARNCVGCDLGFDVLIFSGWIVHSICKVNSLSSFAL